MHCLRILAAACLAALAALPVKAEPSSPQPLTGESAAAAKPEVRAALDEPTPAAGAEAPAATDDKPAQTGGDEKSPADAKQAEPAKPAPPPLPPTLTASIDLGAQEMTVFENGVEKFTWAISSGTADHPTPRGTFRPEWTAKMWYSKKYDNAPMPNAVFINGGVAIHATYATSMLGRPASHGCIRLAPAHAAMFYKLVGRHGLGRTKVSVFGTPKWRAPAVARRDDDGRYAQVDNGGSFWFWGSSSKATSAYDEGFTKRPRRPPPPGYYYADEGPPRGYRRTSDGRAVYIQRQPRRIYYPRYGSGY